jgi:hypothetical protein
MTMLRIAKSIVTAGIGLFILAGPVAFQSGCEMSSNCCCQAEKANETEMGSGGCCSCNMEKAPLPIQSAVNYEVTNPQSPQSELTYQNPEQADILSHFDASSRLSGIDLKIPPLIKAPINTPLIC